jgi:NAD(P) transhydrogenase subunit alpha
MKIAISREIRPGERRVAATPDTVARLRKLGFDVLVEAGAGMGASLSDADYVAAGAEIVVDARTLWGEADILLKVRPPEANPGLGAHEADLLHEGATLVSFLYPGKNKALVERLAARKVSALALDQIPRITRAQKMDALSSMANIAGYRAVIEAASFYGRFFTGQMTAAGRVPPAKVLVVGAGVAGLAAIGAARGLGAIVRAFDSRAAVKEQVESLGAEFIELSVKEEGEGGGGYAKEMSEAYHAAEVAMLAKQCREVDIVITTALIPNQPAPILITEEMVKKMRKGSVIVDLAAENGGNCALTEPGAVVEKYGVHILGYNDLPSRLAPTASQMFGNILAELLAEMGGGENFHFDLDNEVVRGALVLLDGKLLWPPPRRSAAIAAPAAAKPTAPRPSVAMRAAVAAKRAAPGRRTGLVALVLVGAAAMGALGIVAPPAFLSHFTVFVLACVIGWQIIWNVTPALHTPLMSVTNAISGIIVIGGMHEARGTISSPVVLLGAVAILVASVNVVGGFTVTQRMLRMFHR